MRVGMVQFPRASAERATNLIRTLAAIDRAAAADPGPDLLILPARCDGESCGQESNGAVASPDDTVTVTPAMAEAFSESIAARAREWGVFIAFGARRSHNGVVTGGAALFDPDGDVLLECWDCPDRSVGGVMASCGETPIGRLALRFGQAMDQRFDADIQAADPVLAVAWFDGPGSEDHRGQSAEDSESQCRALVDRWRVAVCAVFPPPSAARDTDPVAGLSIWCAPGDCPAQITGQGTKELTMVELK